MDLNWLLEKYDVREDGTVWSVNRKRLLKPSAKKHGYLEVNLCRERIRSGQLVHRLVALKFIPNPDNLPCVNHKNHNRHDNRVENLEWCTYQTNNQNRTNNKLSEDDEDAIRRMYDTGLHTQQFIADLYGLDQGYVSQIVNFKRRK